MPQNCNWGAIKSNILSPLLNAYEEIIDEKNEMIQQIGNELNTFNFRLNEVLQENDKLNGDMCKLSQERDKLEMARAKMEVQFEVCRKRADLQTKRADILQEKLVEVAGSYEAKVQTQALDNERLRDAYCRTKEELSSYKNHPKGQSAELLVVESLKECKSWVQVHEFCIKFFYYIFRFFTLVDLPLVIDIKDLSFCIKEVKIIYMFCFK